MKGNKYIKRVRVDSRQLDSGMIGTKVIRHRRGSC